MNKVQTNDVTKYYQGVVKIQFMKGRKTYKAITIKNSGTSEFFHILCNAVAGNDYSAQMPKYVSICDNQTPLNISRTHFTTVTVSNDIDGWFTDFTFIIPGSYLREGTADNIKLYNSPSQPIELASVDLGESSFTIDTSSNLMINWVLRFKNGEE